MPPASQAFCWRAEDLANRQQWRFVGQPSLLELDQPALRRWLDPLIQELKTGSGAALIQGLAGLNEADLRQLFLAIGRCIGSVDTTYGELYDVVDTGVSYLDKAIPVSQTNASTSVHTDSSRLETHPRWVGLACVRQAPIGGGSRLVSAIAVHEHLASKHPKALQRLYQPFVRDVVTPGSEANALALIATNAFGVYADAADGPTLRYMRYWIEKAHERIARPLDPLDLEAFDLLNQTLNDPQFRYDFDLGPGDLLFIDNHKLAHDRDAFSDDPAAPRLMLRLWLNDPGESEPRP
ncbi:MAG: TauD/TfdA family dioxygenase [Cyanobacteria bacterium K_DeepCast_35m_m2_023]|nr:TauD/TfdA family dioxygenase [Cyanobacteria bacterium K_DeepCast_35m_m2_023]